MARWPPRYKGIPYTSEARCKEIINNMRRIDMCELPAKPPNTTTYQSTPEFLFQGAPDAMLLLDEGAELPCHSNVLRVWSRVLRGLLECSIGQPASNVVDGQQGPPVSLRLVGDKLTTWETALFHIYTALDGDYQCTWNAVVLLEVAVLADKYDITNLARGVLDVVADKINGYLKSTAECNSKDDYSFAGSCLGLIPQRVATTADVWFWLDQAQQWKHNQSFAMCREFILRYLKEQEEDAENEEVDEYMLPVPDAASLPNLGAWLPKLSESISNAVAAAYKRQQTATQEYEHIHSISKQLMPGSEAIAVAGGSANTVANARGCPGSGKHSSGNGSGDSHEGGGGSEQEDAGCPSKRARRR